MPTQQTSDRALIDMRAQRDHLSIQISLLKDSEQPDGIAIFGLQCELEFLDRRIANHSPAPDA